MRLTLLFVLFLLFYSCIPLRVAPTIETDKVMVAKRFKRKLPKQNAFIFEDPKDANEFYSYINTKYELNHIDVGMNTPMLIEGKTYYVTFHEVEIPDKTFNILAIFVDLALYKSDLEPMFEDNYVSRKGNWYLVITVEDEAFKDALSDKYPERQHIINYLQDMRKEYLSTYNYLEALFEKQH